MSEQEQLTVKMLTRREVAEYAGVHVNTVRLWERRGKLHPHREDVNGVDTVFYRLDEVDELIEKRPAPPSADGHRLPQWVLGNQEALQLWQDHQSSIESRRLQGEEIARLEAEAAHLRERLESSERERQSLLDKLLGLVRPPEV